MSYEDTSVSDVTWSLPSAMQSSSSLGTSWAGTLFKNASLNGPSPSPPPKLGPCCSSPSFEEEEEDEEERARPVVPGRTRGAGGAL